jgi:glycosyltransferase involved in cell wall biosynthesis
MAHPAISVVLATYNRRLLLERVLRAYQQQRLPEVDFELVVVDDGSTDDTREFLSAWRPQEYSLRYAFQENGGQGRARNQGLRLASGEIVLFTGDDIVPTPTLLLRHWEAHRAAKDGSSVFVGLSSWPDDIEMTSTMRHVTGVGAQQFSYHYFKDGAEYDFRHFYTSNVSIRRDILDLEPPYFSAGFPKYGFEDVELGYRLAFHGMRIFYLAAAEAHHYHYYTVRNFFARQVSCGEMGAVLYEKFPELAKWVRLAELEWFRLLGLRESGAERRRTTEAAARLDELEERLITFAGFYDQLYVGPVDDLLAAVFDYANLKGFAAMILADEDARRVCAFVFRTRAASAARRFAARMVEAGLSYPALDFQRISAHAP